MTCNQIAEMMGRLTLFTGLSTECLLRLAGGARHFSVGRDAYLFRKGDPAQTIYVLVSGQVKVHLPLASGAEKVIAMIGPGESFGIASVYLGEPYSASALSRTTSHVLAVDRATLLRQAGQDAGLACRLLGAVSRRVSSLLHDMEACAPRSSLQRVSCYLLRQRPHAQVGCYEVILPSTKREMAAHLNLAQETLSRAFQQLSAENAITVQGRRIHVLDSERLMAINLAGCTPSGEVPEQTTQSS